jgi:hypothetical protein
MASTVEVSVSLSVHRTLRCPTGKEKRLLLQKKQRKSLNIVLSATQFSITVDIKHSRF